MTKLRLKTFNESLVAEAAVKIDKSFEPVGFMMKDYKESWNSKEMNAEAKRVKGKGEWIDLNTGGDSDAMVCVSNKDAIKIAQADKHESLCDFIGLGTSYGDIYWDNKKKDFVVVKDGETVYYDNGKGIDGLE